MQNEWRRLCEGRRLFIKSYYNKNALATTYFPWTLDVLVSSALTRFTSLFGMAHNELPRHELKRVGPSRSSNQSEIIITQNPKSETISFNFRIYLEVIKDSIL